MKRADVVLTATNVAPAAGVKPIISEHGYDFKKCEAAVNIGLFFDGTNNNMDRDEPKLAHTNIARLYSIYSRDTIVGNFSIYIPGVGTKFPEIGEEEESKLGAGCAFGCEGRVIFGILSVLNALHRRCHKSNLWEKESILALCRNSLSVSDGKDRESLGKLGVQSGLLQAKIGSNNIRRDFLTRQAGLLEARLREGNPKVVECFIDVFGFSRGAAEARVFCNWLDELLIGGRLAGVPLRFRFLGIFDTVASAGFWSGLSSLVTNSTGGHGAWASAESLRVPAAVKNCVHMIAMHELRRNFPLDEIGVDGKLQPGWVQHAYPGAHSDVGGGYRPGELGIAVESDTLKLSQVPLNHMLDCAIAAGVPLERPKPDSKNYNTFAIHPDLAKAFEDFVKQATTAPRPIYEWLQPYLNWRWQIRNNFHLTNQVKRASPADREILMKFNKSLIDDAAAMTRSATMSVSERTFAVFKDVLSTGARKDLATTSALEPEARQVFALAQHAKPAPQSFATLFDGFVHDSLAGFNSPGCEMTGYWRYRRVFLGSDDHTVAANQETDTARSIA
ncbi:DUF2235 domain-containing protein [Massilia kyonggiensis]|nr:DUF2235 domain-containing protein [Massilia kyonggiensis]